MKRFCLAIVFILCFSVWTNKSDCEEINLISANSIINNLKTKIAKEPNNTEDRIELGVMYFQLQEYAKARQYFEETLGIDNDNAIAHYNLGKTLIILGGKDEGVSECEKSLKLGLDNINVYRTLSVEYFEKRDLEKALNMHKNIQRLEPNNDSAYFDAGVIYIGLRDGWKARKEFEKAIEVNPNNAEAHYELGWLYRDYNPGKSKEHYQKAIKLNPNHEQAKKELSKLLSH